MEFKRIFTKQNDCPLWSVCYPEQNERGKPKDIFHILLNRWKDTEFLDTFFNKENNEKRLNEYWNLTIDQAFNRVELESLRYQIELKAVIEQKPGYENFKIKDLFEKLHTNKTVLTRANETHRKGKPDFENPLLRLYGVELSDETIIVTGGGIKLYDTMQASGLEDEITQMKRVQKFLDEQGIISREGLQ